MAQMYTLPWPPDPGMLWVSPVCAVCLQAVIGLQVLHREGGAQGIHLALCGSVSALGGWGLGCLPSPVEVQVLHEMGRSQDT